MRKVFSKIIAFTLVFAMVGMPALNVGVYAAEEIKSTATSEENVEFNATINDLYDTKANINEKQNLKLSLKVSNTGYLKDIKITLNGANYSITDTKNNKVKSVVNNVIELNEIKAGEIANVSLPIQFQKEDYVSADVFDKTSSVVLSAVYVNDKGKEKKVEKTISEKLEWNTEAKEVVSQKLTRFIKYDENKTLVSFEVKDGIEENALPVLSKELKIDVPKLGDILPTTAVVTGEGIKYEYNKGVLTINKENAKNNEGKILWNSADTYEVNYVYENVKSASSLNTVVKASAKTAKGTTVEATSEENKFEAKTEVGSIVEAETSGTDLINKGYIYTNTKSQDSKLETPFEIDYKINVGIKDLTNKIVLKEQEVLANNSEVIKNVLTKKVSINAEDLNNVLGTDGYIKVLSSDDKELAVINKDKLEVDVNNGDVKLVTSAPVKEGNINVKVQKIIGREIEFDSKKAKELEKIVVNAKVEGYKEDKVISEKKISKEIICEEPSSNADIALGTESLSTVVENENVTINAKLKTNSNVDALYDNPSMKIVLPQQVNNIDLLDARVLYDEELKIKNISTEGNVINIQLEGKQTKYNTETAVDGTVVRMVANISLNNLAPSSKEKINMEYKNEFNNEKKNVSTDINVVAPTGFVTTTTMKANGQTVVAQENDAQAIVFDDTTEDNNIGIEATVVNNLGNKAEGFEIIGRIPAIGNKTETGIDLGSTMNTVLSKEVKVDSEGLKVYYSADENAQEADAWKEEYFANAKSFKIVSAEGIEDKAVVKFSYNVTLPAGTEYGKLAKATYAVKYDNNAQKGLTKNIIQAKSVSISTGSVSKLNTSIYAEDYNEGYRLGEDGSVVEGEYILYKVKVINEGSAEIKNVKVVENLPEDLLPLSYKSSNGLDEFPYFETDSESNQVTQELDSLGVGETRFFEFAVANTQRIDSVSEEERKLTAKFEVSATNIETKNYAINVKNTEGTVMPTLVSNVSEGVKKDDEIDYLLTIKNVNGADKKDVSATISLPNGVEYIGEEFASNYDKRNNTITINGIEIEKGSFYVTELQTKVTDTNGSELSAVATVKIGDKERKSNVAKVNTKKAQSNITAVQSTNITDSTMLDCDDLEFYVDITNKEENEKTIIISDDLNSNLSLTGYRLVVDGNEIDRKSEGYVTTVFNLGSGKTARAIISAKSRIFSRGENVDITNNPVIRTNDNEEISVNSINVKVKGTGDVDDDVQVSTYNNIETAENKYKIAGTVWFDANFNGIKELNEEKFKDASLYLYNRNTGNVVQTVKTDDEGKYVFNNIDSNDYLIVALYDTNKYEIATYRVKNVIDSENNDFVDAMVGNTPAAATDTISLNDSNAYNIDLGLTAKKKFDLSVEQVVSRITVTNTKSENKVYDYNKQVAMVQLATKNVEYATVLVEYSIKVTNEGQIPGYAKSIIDYLPNEMEFNAELNSTWYLGNDGKAYNTTLANTLINPGESKIITLILTKKMTGENTGTARNTVELFETYNEKGLADIDSTAGNRQDNEDDISSTDAVILMATGKEAISYIGIILGIISIVGIAGFLIKKYIINNMYSHIL